MSTETGMSFETVAGSSLIKFKTSLLEKVSKEKFSLPKFLSFYSFLHFQKLYFLLIHADSTFDDICELLVKGVGNVFVVIERFIFFC